MKKYKPKSNEQCIGCLRDMPSGCEAYKERPKDCKIKITDIDEYVKRQTEIMEYNKCRCESGYTQAQKNIKRVLKGVGA